MRLLIDGYNVMHAAGLMEKKFGPDQLRMARQRFLNDLADGLGPIESALTTIVFDAASPPSKLAARATHKGITILFAIEEPDADTQIENLIARHSNPRNLTVVSTDLRIRQAATRRKATARTADAFLSDLADRRKARAHRPTAPCRPDRSPAPDPAEAEYWRREFADLEAQEHETAQHLAPTRLLSDDDLARLEREIEEEFRSNPNLLPPKGLRKRPGQ
jgi:predicted RNA-binding protein with PIN domain